MIPNEKINEFAIYTRAEAARLLGRTPVTIDRWCAAGEMSFGQKANGDKCFKGKHILEKLDEILSGIRWYERR